MSFDDRTGKLQKLRGLANGKIISRMETRMSAVGGRY
jgi:hypothetical protein